jgi:polyhydroxyalkanoate synthesis regulator phasin
MHCVTCARAFKRSWVEMAEALVEVRNKDLHHRWGYDSLFGYAQEELNIKKATVEKLTGSYYALETHAPHVLQWDGVAQPLPEYEIVDYFAKAVDPPANKKGERPDAPSSEVVDDLKRAIFEEQVSGPALKRRFNPILHPKDDDDERRARVQRAKSSARALEGLIADIDGLSKKRVSEVTEALEELRKDLEALDE